LAYLLLVLLKADCVKRVPVNICDTAELARRFPNGVLPGSWGTSPTSTRHCGQHSREDLEAD